MEVPIAPVEPDSLCFGCSQTNEHGLGLRFVQVADHTVETRWTPPAHVCGAPGIVHGGIQAAALDETMGWAAHTLTDDDRYVVTVEMVLRYRRPVHAGQPLVVRASVTEWDHPWVHLEAAIVAPASTATARASSGAGAGGPEGEVEGEVVLTRATARFKDLGAIGQPPESG